MSRSKQNAVQLGLIMLFAAAHVASAVNITIRTNVEKWTISEDLVGLHTRYDVETDAAYDDDGVASWAGDAGVVTMRYPGGSTTKTYNWQAPSGDITVDPWDPSYTGPADPNGWMSLNEYLHFVDVSGIKPLIGINHLSGTLYNRTQDSIDRAAACVQYVKDYGYPGAYYYIGNEDMSAAGGSLEGAANLFVQHAQAMKAVDPNIKIFWNDNNVKASRIADYLAIAGDWADGVEFHGKWPYGGDPNGFGAGTFEEWKTEVPIIDRKAGSSGRTWREKIAEIRTAAAQAGYPNLLMANNEYGLNSRPSKYSGFNKYTKSLVIVDFLQEMFIAGYDMSCFCGNIRKADHGLLSKTADYRKNPMHLGFELMAAAQGATMVDSNSTHPYVYGFAAKTSTDYVLYLLNKTESEQSIDISFIGPGPDTSPPVAEAMVDTADHWGTIETLTVTYDDPNNCFKVTLEPLSYTRIRFQKAAIPAPGTVASANFDAAATQENTTAANRNLCTCQGPMGPL